MLDLIDLTRFQGAKSSRYLLYHRPIVIVVMARWNAAVQSGQQSVHLPPESFRPTRHLFDIEGRRAPAKWVCSSLAQRCDTVILPTKSEFTAPRNVHTPPRPSSSINCTRSTAQVVRRQMFKYVRTLMNVPRDFESFSPLSVNMWTHTAGCRKSSRFKYARPNNEWK